MSKNIKCSQSKDPSRQDQANWDVPPETEEESECSPKFQAGKRQLSYYGLEPHLSWIRLSVLTQKVLEGFVALTRISLGTPNDKLPRKPRKNRLKTSTDSGRTLYQLICCITSPQYMGFPIQMGLLCEYGKYSRIMLVSFIYTNNAKKCEIRCYYCAEEMQSCSSALLMLIACCGKRRPI